jgi:hypothetical protein
MTDPTAKIPDRADEDRVVSRRVDNPTKATESDERAYAAANRSDADRSDADRSDADRSDADDTGGSPGRDGAGAASGIGPDGGASEGVRADRDLRAENESRPTRSE